TMPGPRGTVLVNIVELGRVIAAETDPAQALRNGTAPDEPEDFIVDDEPDAPAAASGPNYHASRANREAYQAENARLDLEHRLKLIAYVDDVDRQTMAATRKIRDRFMALPAMCADRLAAAADARAVRAILTVEIRNLLIALDRELLQMDEDDAGSELDDGAGE